MRRHVTPSEARDIWQAAGQAGRNGARDKCLIMAMYHHGLRVSEAIDWQWHNIDFKTEQVHINRLKGGSPATHPIPGIELRQLRALRRENPDHTGHVFLSERGGPMSPDSVARVIERAGQLSGVGFHVNPHMLRHGCGFYLANKGTDTRTIQAYLGHTQISSTVIYTALAPGRFKDLFRD